MSPPDHPDPAITAALAPRFRALAATIVPDAAGLDEAAWRGLEATVNDALAPRPATLRRQFRLFLRLLDVVSVVRHGRGLAALDPDRRARLLRWLERGPRPLRRGFWGLRALVFLGYWSSPAGAAAAGWHARPEGWSARR